VIGVACTNITWLGASSKFHPGGLTTWTFTADILAHIQAARREVNQQFTALSFIACVVKRV